MSITDFTRNLPNHARDLQANFELLASESLLNEEQKWGAFLACAHAAGYVPLVRAIEAEAAEH